LAQVKQVIKLLDYVSPLFGRLRAKVEEIWLLNRGILGSLSIDILSLLDVHAAWQAELIEIECGRCWLLSLHLLPLWTEIIIPFLLRW
jgi:hypothetical protein